MGVGSAEGLCFDRGFLGDRARGIAIPPPCVFGEFMGPFEKLWPNRLLYATIFKGVWDIIRIKIRHLKGENKSECSIRPDSNWTGKLYSSKRRLIRMSATKVTYVGI